MRNSLLALLLLPSLAFGIPHHGMFAVDNTVELVPIGHVVSWSVDQTEETSTNVPVFELTVSFDEDADIYVEARSWCVLPWYDSYEVDNGPYISDVFGWQLADYLDDVEDTDFTVEWTPSGGGTIEEYHQLGDISYQFRFRFLVDDELTRWYTTEVATDPDLSADTTAPTQSGDLFHDLIVYDEPAIAQTGAVALHGIKPSDDVFEYSCLQISVDFGEGSGWRLGSIRRSAGLIGGESSVILYDDIEELIDTSGDSYSIRYRFMDGLNNSTGWVGLDDGVVSDYECDWDETVDAANAFATGGDYYFGIGVNFYFSCSTLPCILTAQFRVKQGVGDWTETAVSSLGVFHSVAVFVPGADDSDYDVEIQLGDGETTTDWEDLGTFEIE